MPRISVFYGIIIAMYFDDHPAHFHAKYGEHEAQVAIATGEVLRGELPRRARALVEEWAELHRDADYFARVSVDEELGTIVWPNGADLAPDVLHEQAMSLVDRGP
ncbi:MAG: DUF4160 domain-containing protein [Acidimicrobiia bacterium]